MADEPGNPADVLRIARERMVGSRRELATGLALPYDRQKTPGLRERFVSIQSTIDAIDRAIDDEQGSEGPQATKGEWPSR